MQKVLPLILLCFIFSLNGQAQFTRYIIKFKDKGTNPFSLNTPIQYLSQRSLDRRARYNIAIDSSDLPVTPRYIDSLRLAGNVTILNISKWLNQVAILTVDDVALAKINSFPFVESTFPIAARNEGQGPVGKKLDMAVNNTGPGVYCSFFASRVEKYKNSNGRYNFPIDYNTQASFDLDNQLKLDYKGIDNDQTQMIDSSSRAKTGMYGYGKSNTSPKIHKESFLNNHNLPTGSALKATLGFESQPIPDLNQQPRLDYQGKDEKQTQKTDQLSGTTTDIYDYGQSTAQVKIHNGDFLHNHGFRGDGMQMVILDAGFYHYQSLPTFDSIRSNNQILGTWDFVANEASVDEDYYHGMQCLSTIAANMPGTFIGTAPKTSFYLFRTEDVGSEYPIEEQNWAAGIEKADSLGADISSTSLGYSQFDNAQLNHTYADMDGNTTIIARAADVAAKKGILVVAAAGNEGNSTWHYITTPSDADSSLCVGAVDIAGNSAGFSSYGPSSDGQIKPSVAAVGLNAVVANISNGQPSFNSGTSFACPNMAGITTCLWQAFPEANNMGIIAALEASANKADNPDDRTGYGIPDAKKAFVILLKKLYTPQSNIEDCSAFLQFSLKTDNTMSINVERKIVGETNFSSLAGTLQNNESWGMHNFSFSDNISNLSLGNIQYRLKVSIATDTVFYLDTININYTQSCQAVTNNSIAIGPNPFQNSFNVIIGRVIDSKIEVVVHNAAGQKIYSNRFQQLAGQQTWTIPMQNMNSGAYFVSVYINGKKEITKKIVKP